MSVYNRKGGSGKSGSLKEQFNYYKKQLEKRLVYEQAFKEARGGGTIEARIKTMFKDLNYEKTMSEGITRKVKGKTIRYTGSQAVIVRIQSMRMRASKSYQTDLFMRNYLNTMKEVGFSYKNIDKVSKTMRSISIDKLTYLVDKGILPSIQFIYAEQGEDEDELTEEIINALENGVSNETVKAQREKAKASAKVLQKLYEIIGW